MPKWFLLGFIRRIDNFKKKSLCELKLKTEKFENIHTQKNKKEKIRKKKEKKKKNRYTSVQSNKKEEGKYKEKKKRYWGMWYWSQS